MNLSFYKSLVFERLDDDAYIHDYLDAYLEGYAEGFAKGYAKGYAEGYAKGLRKSVVLLLECRGLDIPEAARTRITACDDHTLLTHWLDRGMTAACVDDLFADEPTSNTASEADIGDGTGIQADQEAALIPRPRRTPGALLAALAAVDPDRLDEMRRTKDEAFAEAVERQSMSPVGSWVLAWARDIEIARRPGLSARQVRARGLLEHEDPAVARKALRELRAVRDEAMVAMRG
ncbi:hypothetical protein ACIPEL_21195 [Streptomyces griseoviridis]